MEHGFGFPLRDRATLFSLVLSDGVQIGQVSDRGVVLNSEPQLLVTLGFSHPLRQRELVLKADVPLGLEVIVSRVRHVVRCLDTEALTTSRGGLPYFDRTKLSLCCICSKCVCRTPYRESFPTRASPAGCIDPASFPSVFARFSSEVFHLSPLGVALESRVF